MDKTQSKQNKSVWKWDIQELINQKEIINTLDEIIQNLEDLRKNVEYGRGWDGYGNLFQGDYELHGEVKLNISFNHESKTYQRNR